MSTVKLFDKGRHSIWRREYSDDCCYRHAAPLCKAYGAEHHWTYQSLDYPNGGHSNNAGSATCVFVDASGNDKYVSLTRLEPNWLTDLGVSFAFEMEFTLPLFFVLVALLFAAFKRKQKQ